MGIDRYVIMMMNTEDPSAVPSTTAPTDIRDADAGSLSPERLAQLAASYAADKKAIDLTVLDLRGVSSYTDFFVVCSGNTDRQSKAIHDAVHEGLKKDHGILPRRVEGVVEARWILLDYFDIVVHVFVPEVREFYRLEQLWGDVPRLDVELEDVPSR
jgi:ribosome-associated protein